MIGELTQKMNREVLDVCKQYSNHLFGGVYSKYLPKGVYISGESVLANKEIISNLIAMNFVLKDLLHKSVGMRDKSLFLEFFDLFKNYISCLFSICIETVKFQFDLDVEVISQSIFDKKNSSRQSCWQSSGVESQLIEIHAKLERLFFYYSNKGIPDKTEDSVIDTFADLFNYARFAAVLCENKIFYSKHRYIRVYIASGWFDEQQYKDVEDIKEVLTKMKISFFSPKDDNLASPKDSKDHLRKVFTENVKQVNYSNLIVCNTRNKDMGSIFEAGISFSKNVPIIYYNTQTGKGNFNLMLANSGIFVAYSKEELQECLFKFRANPLFELEYGGSIE